MLEAAPDVVACPQVGNTLGQSLASVSSKVQDSLHEEMPDCKTSMLSFWTLPAQQIQRNLSFQDWNFEVTVQLPAGSFWSVFQELLSSKDQTQVLLAVQAHSCNRSPSERLFTRGSSSGEHFAGGCGECLQRLRLESSKSCHLPSLSKQSEMVLK